MLLRGLRERALQPIAADSLVALRSLFGLLIAVASVRFVARGWVFEHFGVPRHFFSYWGFDWLEPMAPLAWMYGIYALLFVSSLSLALGLRARLSAALMFVSFSYLHLCDKTHYLNHYYLVSLLAGMMVVVPIEGRWTLSRSQLPWPPIPRWVLWAFRIQIGLVYFYAGVAKLGHDWLFEAQPLTIWLRRHEDIAWVGPLLAQKSTAYAMSWLGAFFDLTIVGWLSLRRTRRYAYAALLAFHTVTGALFHLGMFPFIMSAMATVFFAENWPARFLGQRPTQPTQPTASAKPVSKPVAKWFLAGHLLVQAVLPLRSLVATDNVLWSEHGFRFAWRVMLIEKNGHLMATAVNKVNGAKYLVAPGDYLTEDQERMMATQPDMILQFSHMVRDHYAARGIDVAVYVDVSVSLNGRPATRLVDPNVDLAAEREGWAEPRWVLPAPTTRPRF